MVRGRRGRVGRWRGRGVWWGLGCWLGLLGGWCCVDEGVLRCCWRRRRRAKFERGRIELTKKNQVCLV